MRFTLIKNLKDDSSMRPIISGLLLFMLLYIIADIFVKHSSLGLTPQLMGYTLFGDEDEFLDPITESSFLEIWHSDIFMIMMILLTLSSVYARVIKSQRVKLLSINLVMLSAILSLISLPLAFYISSSFIYPFLLTFLLWHLLSAYMVIHSLWRLYD